MSAWLLLAVPLGGLGAVARVWLTRVGERRLPGGAPTATALINLAGALVLGLVAGVAHEAALLVLGAGLLGGLTTFSTWMVEVDEAHRTGHLRAALLLLVVPALVGAAAYAAGYALVS